MLNNILNGTSRTGSSTTARRTGSSTTARGSYQGRSGSTSTGTTNTGISVVEKKGDNAITVHSGENSYRIENKTAQEFLNETNGYSSAQKEEYAKSISENQAATNTGGTTTTPPPTDTGGTTTTTPPPTDTGGTPTEEESDNTLMYILIAAIVGVALFPTGKKKKKKK